MAPAGHEAVTLLELENVTAGYADKVLDGVSLSLGKGAFVSIVGPSGCGKSTILKALTGAVEPDAGSICLDGEPLTKTHQPFAFMPQRDALMPWRRIIDNVTLGLEVQGMPRIKARQKVAPLFSRFGLEGFARHYPSQLSGGMRQRAALMRTIVQEKAILLLDEPFSALDALTRVEMQRWLEAQRLHGQWSTLLITHDVREAIVLSDRIYVLSRRPARVLSEITIPLPRPRRGPDFLRLAAEIEADIHDLLLSQKGNQT